MTCLMGPLLAPVSTQHQAETAMAGAEVATCCQHIKCIMTKAVKELGRLLCYLKCKLWFSVRPELDH